MVTAVLQIGIEVPKLGLENVAKIYDEKLVLLLTLLKRFQDLAVEFQQLSDVGEDRLMLLNCESCAHLVVKQLIVLTKFRE